MPVERTLLLTDVVGSTRLSEVLGETATAALWARHDRIARDLLPAHRGREIDKTDGFLLLFETAAEAVAYAMAYHAALRPLEISARAGIHTGPVILTENAPEDVARGAKPVEVDGIAKPTAARVMSVALGGQTLATSQAIAALGDTPLRIVSHGHWRMKGVAEPHELFEVGDEHAPMTPPPDGAKAYRVVDRGGLWLPVREVKHTLPRERDAFVGRDADLKALARLLEEGAALVSVLGVGGTGKTRLVTRFGWTWLGDWPGGVWFCDLSEARSDEGIATAVAQGLDIPLDAGDPLTRLGHAIAGRGRCLVVLDNFEQVADRAEATLGRWLDRAPDAQFVVTTREVLGLPGETTLGLPPLDASEAVALFVARAAQANRDFAPSASERAEIASLVALLDRLPLAIELAAARIRILTPAKLLERMSERFRLLTSTGGRRDRQATLRATLDWSWDLLSEDERAALAQLSVFEGGFTMEAAESILELDALWAMDAVQALVDKSLVRRVGEDRFDLLVTVQEYAAEKLADAHPGAVLARHGAWCAAFGSPDAVEMLQRHGGAARRHVVAAERDNLVAGCRRAVARGDGETAVATCRAIWPILLEQGPASVGVELAELVAAMPDLAPPDRASITSIAANANAHAGRRDAAGPQFERAVAVYEALGSRREAGRVLAMKAWLLQNGGAEGARECYELALAIHRETGDRVHEGNTLSTLGTLHWYQGRQDEAQACYEAGIAIHREVGNENAEGVVLGNLGLLLSKEGRSSEARDCYDRALAIHRATGDRKGEACVLANLGSMYQDLNQSTEARAWYEQALALHREVGNRLNEGVVHANLGTQCVVEGRLDEAQTHLEQALAVSREVGNRRLEGFVLGGLGHLHRRRGEPAQALDYLDQALPILEGVGDRVQIAGIWCHRAAVLAPTDPDGARAALARAEAYADETGAGPDAALRVWIRTVERTLIAPPETPG